MQMHMYIGAQNVPMRSVQTVNCTDRYCSKETSDPKITD